MFATRVRTRSEAENPDARTTPCYRVRMANELVMTVSSEKPILGIYLFESRVSRQEREILSFSLRQKRESRLILVELFENEIFYLLLA